jgi:hypothetical protein
MWLAKAFQVATVSLYQPPLGLFEYGLLGRVASVVWAEDPAGESDVFDLHTSCRI